MSKERSQEKIIEMLNDGWKLFGTPHMRSPKGYIVQVHRTTFKNMIKNGLIVAVDKTHRYEYVKESKPDTPKQTGG